MSIEGVILLKEIKKLYKDTGLAFSEILIKVSDVLPEIESWYEQKKQDYPDCYQSYQKHQWRFRYTKALDKLQLQPGDKVLIQFKSVLGTSRGCPLISGKLSKIVSQ
ncbi:hypothetical protein H6G76_35070 [Nostoc sp. FACHB-152]|uniref:hypothetical protein n=1 Tax=Nostoc sp. FACHB-152 TaxID=2692837 RepID=UPI00168880B5|nr:hypothetical protein [Nostoc sp. FACHB-152]MBD2452233.1 hypothetical protein [Nostoc sp. FACHB-152]